MRPEAVVSVTEPEDATQQPAPTRDVLTGQPAHVSGGGGWGGGAWGHAALPGKPGQAMAETAAPWPHRLTFCWPEPVTRLSSLKGRDGRLTHSASEAQGTDGGRWSHAAASNRGQVHGPHAALAPHGGAAAR